MDCALLSRKHLPETIELRHQLHRIPEVAYQEVKTAGLIREQLHRLGLPFVANIANAPTATVAHIGTPSKPCIALRADIDALPITELTGLPYASVHPGRMHACGHDGHIATLLGVAAALKSIEKDLPVCVKLFWQPAEEGGAGAKRLIDAGLLDGRIGPKPSAVFGLHGWPGLSVGKVSTKAGALLAATDSFTIEFVGSGTHAAYPHMGRDPIVTACEAVLNLQQIVSRDIDPTEPVVVTIGKFHAGTATNVIPDTAMIEGTVRTLNDAHRAKAREALQRRAGGIAAANGCKANFVWSDGYPPTINDPAMADFVATTARQSLGPDCFLPAARSSMGGEDFAYYLEKIPGCFFFVGTCPPDRKANPPLHSDRYDFTDAALEVAMRMFLEIVARFPAFSR
jgi:amidohydrolase